jgi:hypothetical protein
MDHMAKEPFEVVWWPLVLLSAGGIHSAASRALGTPRLLGVSPDAVVAFNLLVISIGYLHYVTGVISETCSFLGIRCLTIDVEKARRAKEEAAAAAEVGRGAKKATATSEGAAAKRVTSNGAAAKRATATSSGGTRKAAAAPAAATSSTSPRRRRSSSRSRK